jgi:hypothetical protein
MSKTNFYTFIFILLIAIFFLINTLINSGFAVDSLLIYSIVLFMLGELTAITTTINIQNITYIRSEEESAQTALPRVPFEVKKALAFIPINIIVLTICVYAIYYFIDETQRVYLYTILLLPLSVHLLSLIPFFLFRNAELIGSKKRKLEDDDRYSVIVQIGKKLANRESKSCRKTNTNQYRTLLHYLKNGQNPDEVFEERYTLLLPSACCGDEKLVKLLIEHGSNVNYINTTGTTALILACKHGFYDIALLLIENGADINIKDSEGKTALSYAEENNFTDIVEILRENR